MYFCYNCDGILSAVDHQLTCMPNILLRTSNDAALVKAQFDTTDNLLISDVMLEVLRVYSHNWSNDIQQIVTKSELQSIFSIHCGFM